MGKNKWFYTVFSILLFFQIMNLTFKLFNPYYFGLIFVGLLVVVNTVFGIYAGIKKFILVTFAVVGLLLVGAMFFIVWN